MVHPSLAHCPLLRLCPLQKRERKANKDYGKNFKAQPSKEDKQAKRKQILSSIGERWVLSSMALPPSYCIVELHTAVVGLQSMVERSASVL